MEKILLVFRIVLVNLHYININLTKHKIIFFKKYFYARIFSILSKFFKLKSIYLFML